jgi:hypothetical protein
MPLFFKKQKHFALSYFLRLKKNLFNSHFCVKKLRKLLNGAINQNIGKCDT